MGDRRNIILVQHGDRSEERIYLYSHNHGMELPAVLQHTLRNNGDRWDDEPYLVRHIVSDMVLQGVLYGVSTYFTDSDNETTDIVVDVKFSTITVGENEWAFIEYIQLEARDLNI